MSRRAGESALRALRVTARKGQETEEQSSRQLAQALGKLIALVLVVIAVILIERYCTVEVPPFGPGANIVSVDGDTIRAANGAEYRLFGIDAPELAQTCTEANGKTWLCGRAAKAKLTTLIKGGNVTCESRATDRFGRKPLSRCRGRGANRQARHLAWNFRAALRLALGEPARRKLGPCGVARNGKRVRVLACLKSIWRCRSRSASGSRRQPGFGCSCRCWWQARPPIPGIFL